MALEPILFVPDVHVPFEDKRAWNLMLKVGKDLKPKRIVVLGDLVDFYSVSSHSKDPNRALQLPHEIEAARRCLDQLDGLGARDKIYIEGNHEDRLRRYLQDKAPELFGVVGVPALLSLRERGWKHIPYKKHTKVGLVYATHDVGASGQNAVFKALAAFQHSVVSAHSHRMAYVVGGDALGEPKISCSFGWLGDADAVDYMQDISVRTAWSLGFGIGYLNTETGIVHITPVPVVKYSVVVNGRLYQG